MVQQKPLPYLTKNSCYQFAAQILKNNLTDYVIAQQDILSPFKLVQEADLTTTSKYVDTIAILKIEQKLTIKKFAAIIYHEAQSSYLTKLEYHNLYLKKQYFHLRYYLDTSGQNQNDVSPQELTQTLKYTVQGFNPKLQITNYQVSTPGSNRTYADTSFHGSLIDFCKSFYFSFQAYTVNAFINKYEVKSAENYSNEFYENVYKALMNKNLRR